MKIHIFGASGSGVTTLGKALSAKLKTQYFDSDDFYWEKSDPPFTVRRNQQEREQLVDETLAKHPAYILGGSIIGWGKQWLSAFDLVVFLYLPPNIRLDRLRKREMERYGDIIFTNAHRNELYEQFIDWAAGYDESKITSGTRTLANHEAWLQKLICKRLEMRGDFTVDERIKMVIEKCNP